MGFLRLIIAILAVYLFVRFLGLIVLLMCRLVRPSGGRTLVPAPDDVFPTPVLSLKGFGYYVQMGRDRFGRMIYKVPDGRGTFLYVYLDHAPSEAQRPGPGVKRSPAFMTEEDSKRAARKSRPALGWKGFTADSSPWEVLGVAKDASVAQIKTAYRKLIAKYHPDRFANLSGAEIEQLVNDSKLINAAYAELVKS